MPYTRAPAAAFLAFAFALTPELRPSTGNNLFVFALPDSQDR